MRLRVEWLKILHCLATVCLGLSVALVRADELGADSATPVLPVEPAAEVLAATAAEVPEQSSEVQEHDSEAVTLQQAPLTEPEATEEASIVAEPKAQPAMAAETEQQEAPEALSQEAQCGSSQDAKYLRRIDRLHRRLSSGVCLPGLWFDQFFDRPGMENETEATTFIRVIGTGNWQEDNNENSNLRVKARVDLPNLEERLSLVFRNDDDISESGRELTRAQTGEDSAFQAALRWASLQREKHDLDIEAGLRSGLKTFVRARYQWKTYLPGDKWGVRFSDSLYWKDTIGVGNEWRLELERPLTRRLLLRLASRAEINETMYDEGKDFTLSQYASIYFWLSRKSALEWYTGTRAYTAPNTHADEYRTGLRLRQNIWREWFFVELEPYAFWPREYGFEPVHGVFLRLETQWGNY